MTRARLGLLLLCALCTQALGQGILEVRRLASIYAEAAKGSEVVHEVAPRQGEVVTLNLAEEKSKNGYYMVRVPGSVDETGWVYKTYVRRLETPRSHPKYVPYDRALYKHWTDEDKNCRNTRDEVLVRDAIGEVTFKDARKCKVQAGVWPDPYTGKKVSDPARIDVDHLVPLKNAHESGGWAWSAEKRQRYANFMGDGHHLVAVSASENRSKADKGPERYMPPYAASHCTYLRYWAKVKADWGLSMKDDERATVANGLQACPD